MSTTLTNTTLRASKIIHRSPILHPLARFVSEDAIAIMFNIPVAEIERIECYRYMVYVHARHVSRFVSYADFPPMVNVPSPNLYDGWRWRKRWRRRWHRSTAPAWWQDFYLTNMSYSQTEDDLRAWGNLITDIEEFLSAETRKKLGDIYGKYEAKLQEMMNVM